MISKWMYDLTFSSISIFYNFLEAVKLNVGFDKNHWILMLLRTGNIEQLRNLMIFFNDLIKYFLKNLSMISTIYDTRDCLVAGSRRRSCPVLYVYIALNINHEMVHFPFSKLPLR